MPIPMKWKLVAGTVTAVVGVSAAAAALPGTEPEDIELKDPVSVTAVTSAPSIEASDFVLADADDSLASPFDSVDTDGDGLSDVAELTLITDPGDGQNDPQALDPLDPDTDGDGLSDGEEVTRFGTNPLVADSDGDGFTDGVEVDASTDPLDPLDYPGLYESDDSPD